MLCIDAHKYRHVTNLTFVVTLVLRRTMAILCVYHPINLMFTGVSPIPVLLVTHTLFLLATGRLMGTSAMQERRMTFCRELIPALVRMLIIIIIAEVS